MQVEDIKIGDEVKCSPNVPWSCRGCIGNVVDVDRLDKEPDSLTVFVRFFKTINGNKSSFYLNPKDLSPCN